MTVRRAEIHLENLHFQAYHGVLEQERKVGGDYTVNLSLRLSDATRAIREDDLEGTVNYAEVYAVVKAEMAKPSALLEHVCGNILDAVFLRFPLVAAARITLRKDNPPMGADCDGCTFVLEAER